MIWVGPKQSDIHWSNNFFEHSVTICGDGTNGNHSLSIIRGKRENYNSDNFSPGHFFNEEICKIINVTDTKLMFYNPQFVFAMNKKIISKTVCLNDCSLLEFLNNKVDFRLWASRYVPVVPFIEFTGSDNLPNLSSGKYVIQATHSSGGYGTYMFDTEYPEKININNGYKYLASNYYKNTIPCNVNIIIFDNDVLIFPPSIQIIHRQALKLLYLGADYSSFGNVANKIKEKLKDSCLSIAEKVRGLGYRGIIGFDFLASKDEVLLIEANPRFQASTFLLAHLLKKKRLPNLFELNICAFKHQDAPKVDLFDISSIGSTLSYIYGTEKNVLTAVNNDLLNKSDVDILWDGYNISDICQPEAYLFRCIFKDKISSISADNTVILHQNLYSLTEEQQKKIRCSQPTIYRKIALINQGITFSENAKEVKKICCTGVHNSIDIELDDGTIVNCPINIKYGKFTPFHIERDSNKVLYLSFYGERLCNIRVFHKHGKPLKTSTGLPYDSCSFWAIDRLRIHHQQVCLYKSLGQACAFCNAPNKEEAFNLDDIREVVNYYSKKNELKHFLIGGGSAPSDYESEKIIEIAQIIREIIDKEIYVMCIPINSEAILYRMKSVGITQIAFNIEIFERSLAKKYMPGKGAISLERYMESLQLATKLWGKTGNVRTLFVAGLEPMESLLQGIKAVSSIGVQPIISAFRPLPGTDMYDVCPPSNAWLMELYQKADKICKINNQILGPDCHNCRNNTIS